MCGLTKLDDYFNFPLEVFLAAIRIKLVFYFSYGTSDIIMA